MRVATRCTISGNLLLAVITSACGADGPSRQSATAYDPTTTVDPTSGGDDSTSTSSASDATSSTSQSTSTTASGDTSTSVDPTNATITTATTSESTGGSSACDGIDGAELIPPVSCDGPSGNTSTEVPPNGLFSTSWFGCYFGEDGEIG